MFNELQGVTPSTASATTTQANYAFTGQVSPINTAMEDMVLCWGNAFSATSPELGQFESAPIWSNILGCARKILNLGSTLASPGDPFVLGVTGQRKSSSSANTPFMDDVVICEPSSVSPVWKQKEKKNTHKDFVSVKLLIY